VAASGRAGDQASTVAHRKKLGEARNSEIAEAAKRSTTERSEKAMCTIFDKGESAVIAKSAYRRKILWKAEIIDRHQGASALIYLCRNVVEINGEIVTQSVEDWVAAEMDDGFHHGNAVVSGDQDFLARANTDHLESVRNRHAPGCDIDGAAIIDYGRCSMAFSEPKGFDGKDRQDGNIGARNPPSSVLIVRRIVKSSRGAHELPFAGTGARHD
jgi:hypothetical protein